MIRTDRLVNQVGSNIVGSFNAIYVHRKVVKERKLYAQVKLRHLKIVFMS